MILSIDSCSFYSLHLRVPFIDVKEVDVLDAWFDLMRLGRADPDIDYDGFIELAWEFISDACHHLSIAIPEDLPVTAPLIPRCDFIENLSVIPDTLVQVRTAGIAGACRMRGCTTERFREK